MREKSNVKTQVGKLLQFRGIAIVLFLVLLFVCVVSLGITNADTTNPDVSSQIALAKDETGGSASDKVVTVSIDSSAEPTAAMYNYPGTSATTFSKSTNNLTTTTISYSSQSVRAVGWTRTDTPAAPNTSTSADNGTMKLQINSDGDNRYNQACGVVNFNLNEIDFLNKMISNTAITSITATVTATYSYSNVHKNDNGYHGYQIGTTADGKCADNFSGDFANITYILFGDTFSTSGNWTRDASVSKAVTIKNGTSKTPFIHLALFLITDASDTGYVQLSGITIKSLSITRNNSAPDTTSTYINDGAAPQITSFDFSTDKIATKPYRPDNTQDADDWNVFYDTSTTMGAKVASTLSKAKDIVNIGSKVKLNSYENTSLFTWSSIPAYKRLSFLVEDYYDYDETGDAVKGGSDYPLQASGIKSVQVGDVPSSVTASNAVFSLANNQSAFTNTTAMTSGGTNSNIKKIYYNQDETLIECGYAYVKREGSYSNSSVYSSRNKVLVVIFFTKNCDLTVTIADYGDKIVKQKIEVRGIDTTQAVAPTLSQDDGFVSTTNSYANLNWIYSNSFDFDGTDNSDALEDSLSFAPHIYYYEMQKLGNATTESDPTKSFSAHSNLSKAALLTRQPYAVGSFTGFSYDFSKGCTSSGIYPSGGTASNGGTDNYCKGNGYYRVYIYALDLAGNLSSTVQVYYFKVDYEEATYDLSMSYTFNGQPNVITAANNGTWATSAMVATLTQNKVSLSGNTIVFEDADGNSHTIIIGSHATKVKSSGAVDTPCIARIDGTLLTNVPTLSIGGVTYYEIVENQIYFTSTQLAYGQTTYIYKIYFLPDIPQLSNYATLDYSTIIEIANGVDYDNAEVVYHNTNWNDGHGNDGVIIRVDRMNPSAPSISDEDGKFVGIDISSVLPADLDDLGINANTERYWYTSGYTIPIGVNFPETLAETYQTDIRAYIGIVNIELSGNVCNGFKTLSQFTNLDQTTRNNVNSYATALNGIFGGATYWRQIDAGNFTDAKFDIANYNLITQFGIGLRVVYTWAIDQAGNMGDVQVYYILVDPTTYYVTAQINSGDISRFGEDEASISITDETENTITSFKRGDVLTIRTSISSDFVIYTLNKKVGSAVRTLGENTASTDMLEVLDESYVSYDGGVFTITADVASVFSYYNTEETTNPTNARIYYELTYRKIIYPSVIATYARYAGLESNVPLVKVPYTMDDMSDDAQAALTFTFYTDENYSVLTTSANAGIIIGGDGSTPVNVGTYYVAINSDSEFYIINQTVKSIFNIVAANLQIQMKDNLQAQYLLTDAIVWENCITITGLLGDAITDYGVNGSNLGLAIFDAGQLGLKDVNGVVQDLSTHIPVGTYTIFQQVPFALANYNISFTANKMDVIPYKITAEVESSSKIFGDADDIRTFKILKSAFTSIVVDWDEVFSSTNVTCETSGDYYLFTPIGIQWIQRAAGENIGAYEIYLATNEFITISNNFEIELTSTATPYLTINKRYITITPLQGQKYEDNVDPTNIGNICYTYPSSDAKYFTSEYVAGELALASNYYSMDDSHAGKVIYQYEIVLGTFESITENIEITFTSGVLFTVTLITSGEVIRVSQVTYFSVPYQQGFANQTWNNVDFHTEVPDSLTNAYGSNWGITWAISSIGPTANVGTHPIEATGAKVYDTTTGQDIDGYTVVVNTIYVTVTPLPITITPIISATTKTYGDLDSTSWNITYKAIRDNTDMSGIIQPGEFTRAIFRKSDNGKMALGSRYDIVSDANGELTFEGVAAYYGLGIRIDFETTDANYCIEYADFSNVRFNINVRKIVVDPNASFFGVNKQYDGSLTATYGAGDTSIIFGDYLARQEDDVQIAFEAAYDTANAGSGKTITFSNLSLTGSAAGNYVLYFGTDLENVPYVAQTVLINKLIPTAATGPDNEIQIYSITVIISKADFTISKQYDGTTTMNSQDLSIDSSSVLSSFNYSISASSYPSFEVSNAYSTNVTIIFTYESSSNTENMNIVDNDDEDITVVDDGAGKITVVLRNMPVSITKKILTIDDIVGIEGVNRYYDASTKVSVIPTISSEALAFGDNSADTFIKFTAHAATITSTDPGASDQTVVYNASTYYVVYEKDAKATAYNVFLEGVAITSAASNYLVDISAEDLALFSIANKDDSSVIINKATLNLSAIIGATEYTGISAVDSSLIGTATQVTSAISSDLIVTSEFDVANINDIYNELANITYNDDSIKAYYTKDGVLYPYIVFNDDGSIAKHEISIANLILSKDPTSGLTDDQVNAILANYTLAGTAYTISDEGATAVATDQIVLTLGTVIPADVYTTGGVGLSSIITATLYKKSIQINAANITLPNKVYDGTTLGSATVDDVLAIGIVPSDADKINVSLTATYATKDVGTKIRVDISNVTFTDKEEYAVNHSSNYAIGTSSAYAFRSITKSYAVIDFDLASKVYDGTNMVAQNAIMPVISVPYARDSGLYSVNTSFAFLGGANVVTEGHTESDSATIYGIKLVSSRTTVNYDLYVKQAVDFNLYENGIKTSDFEDFIADPANALLSMEATDFYYALNGTNEVYFALRVDTIKTIKAKDYPDATPEIGADVVGYGTYLGCYVSNTIRYYAFESDAAEAKEYYAMDITAQYSHFVNAATLAFSIKPQSGSSSFTKVYDGTADLTEEYIVTFETGLTDEEKDAIKNALIAKYSSANVGASMVVFTISDNVPLNNTNYTVTDVKVSVAGYITKSTINAYLEDTEVQYGTLIADRKYNIIYGTYIPDITPSAPLINRTASDNVDIFVLDGKFGYYQISLDGSPVEGKKYYKFTSTYKQVSITRFASDRHYYYIDGDVYKEDTIYDSEKVYYICEAIEYTETEFTPLDVYEFVPISGTIIAPAVKSSVTNSTNAKAEGYPMYLNGGSATNFNFKYSYTNGTNSKLIVTKVTLYAYVVDDYVDEEGSAVNYASSVVYTATGTMPQFTLGYAASPTTMLSGFVNGQTSAIFNQSANTAPVTKVYLFNGTDYLEKTSMAGLTVSEELEAGSYYVIYIDITDAVAVNYTFALKAGADISNSVKLLLQYPDITDYAVADTVVTYTGSKQDVKVTGTGATVTYQYFTNSEMTTPVGTSVTNAGEYYAKVTIAKPQHKTLVQYASLTIKKANFKISIPSKDVDYDGTEHTVEIRTSSVAPSISSISVKYEINGEQLYGATNVGSYLVTATYTTVDNYSTYNGGQYNDNYNSATGTGSLVVQGAVVQVIVSESDKIAKLDKEDEAVQMHYTINVEEKYKDMLEAAGYDYDNYIEDLIDGGIITVQYYNVEAETTDDYLTEIDETGVYNYIIVCEPDANIILKGSVSGTFTVGVESIEYLNSAEKRRALITAQGNTILSANASIVYEKVTYTSKIGSQSSAEAYQAAVANNKLYTQIESNIPSLATRFHDTEMLGVLKVQMRVTASDGTSYLIQPNGKVKVSVYATVPIEDTTKIYQVTADGKLAEVDYTYSNGFVTYETDYVNTIVFVKVGTFLEFVMTNWWLLAAAGGALLVILIIIIVPSAVVASKKKKAKKAAKLAAATAGAESAGATAPVAETAAPAPQTPVQETAPVEEPKPVEEPAPPVEEPPMDEMPPIEEPPMDIPPEEVPPMEEPPAVEPPAPVEEPAPAPEKPQGPPPGAIGKKAPPPGAVGQKPDAAPKKAPPPGAVGQKPAAAPKKAPPPGAIGKK